MSCYFFHVFSKLPKNLENMEKSVTVMKAPFIRLRTSLMTVSKNVRLNMGRQEKLVLSA